MAVSPHEQPGRDEGARPGPAPDDLGERLDYVLRGLWAAFILLFTALDELATALIGIRPITPLLRKIGHELRQEYRAGANGWIDADVIDLDNPRRVEP